MQFQNDQIIYIMLTYFVPQFRNKEIEIDVQITVEKSFLYEYARQIGNFRSANLIKYFLMGMILKITVQAN